MKSINPIWAHVIVSVCGMIGMVVVNVWGNEAASLNAIFGAAIAGGGWGAIQRQKDPVEK